MLPCASAAGPVLKQLKSDSVTIRCAAIRALAALVRTAGPDIPRSDVLKPVGRAVTDGSADVRVACGEAVGALAGKLLAVSVCPVRPLRTGCLQRVSLMAACSPWEDLKG